MNRKTLGALAAFAALFLVALVVWRSPEKGQRVGEKQRPLAAVKAGDFDALEITRGKDAAAVTTTLTKDGDKFKVTKPVVYAADPYAAKQAFEAIEKLDWGDLVTEKKDKQAEFEVGPDGVRVVAKKGAAVLADLVVGKVVNGTTMVRLTGKDQVWQVAGYLKSTFDKDTAAWRDKTITSFKEEDAQRLQIDAPGGARVILEKKEPPKDDKNKKPAGPDEWTVVASTVPIPELDKTAASGVASALANLKASDFADAVKLEEAGLAEPQLTATAKLKDGKSVSVLVGKKKGEDEHYVKSGESPQIFLVKKYALDRLLKPPIELRDKTVCNLSDADLVEVAVTHGADSFTIVKKDTDWKAAKPAGLELDATKLTPLLNGFKEWKAQSFAEDPSPKATGLGKPQATISARSKDKKICALKIGDETKDKQGYFAQPAGSRDVYVLAKWSTERVLKKIDDIKKPGSTLAKK